MTRLPAAAFAALVLATVGAFFVTQHLKVSNPLIQGSPRPDPPAINPIAGRKCRDLAGKLVSFKRTKLSFYLQSRADTVAVYMVNAQGVVVSTVSPGRHMQTGPKHRSTFTWNGRSGSGHGPVVPDGTYYFRIALQHAGRTFTLTGNPVQVITTPPRPSITRVEAAGSSSGTGPARIHGGQSVTIHFPAAPYKSTRIEIYRTDLPGKPQLAFSFGAKGKTGSAVWNGRIHGRLAPPGTYLIGLAVTDQACNQGNYPLVLPPSSGSTAHAGVTVTDLAATPPMTPVPAGSDATMSVDAGGRPFSWTLRRFGSPKLIAHGREPAGSDRMRVRIPYGPAALYAVSLAGDGQRTEVPLVADATGRDAYVKILVVLPSLTWQGLNPVDDTGDGLPSTLSAGDRISLDRPLVTGLPRGFGSELALISYLHRRHLYYQLTTDVGLADGVGPHLHGHSGVLLDGSLLWMASDLGGALSGFAKSGGSVVSVGAGSLQSEVQLSGSPPNQTAGPPTPMTPDPFGSHHGAVGSTRGALLTVLSDHLKLFGNAVAFPGFTVGQTINPPAGTSSRDLSLVGVGFAAPDITGFRDGRGTVVEVGLPQFSASLTRNVDAQELLANLWKLLSR